MYIYIYIYIHTYIHTYIHRDRVPLFASEFRFVKFGSRPVVARCST